MVARVLPPQWLLCGAVAQPNPARLAVASDDSPRLALAHVVPADIPRKSKE